MQTEPTEFPINTNLLIEHRHNLLHAKDQRANSYLIEKDQCA
jgi:hypothetical protein